MSDTFSSAAACRREGDQPRRSEPTASENVEVVDLFDLGSLVRWIEWADIGLLDTNWLLEAPPEVILNRRQELPPEAFVPIGDLRARPIVALSYGWADPANPDPRGDYADMLKNYFGKTGHYFFPYGKTKYPEGAALFWDHKSLYQHRLQPDWDGRRETFAQSLIQKRTPAEEVMFQRAMRGMQALYFHAHADALIAMNVPERCRNPRPYGQRGWTAMESAGACLSGRLIVLQLNGKPEPISTSEALVTPMPLEDFEEKEMKDRAFFNEGDRPEVVRMYSDGFAAYVRSSEELSVLIDGANQEKLALLARTLPRFERLRHMRLTGYPLHKLDHRLDVDDRSAELDEALDALARRGCRVFAGTVRAHLKQWLPDAAPGGREMHVHDHNPAHRPPRPGVSPPQPQAASARQ